MLEKRLFHIVSGRHPRVILAGIQKNATRYISLDHLDARLAPAGLTSLALIVIPA